MDEGNNNGSFIPMEELPRYNINTAISLHIFGLYVKFNFNRRGISLSRREMRYEFVRYITFYDSPRSLRDIRDFVKAGFYYSQDRDIVVCYCCGYCRGNWHIAEVPLDIHQRFSPNCIFFDANVTVDIPYNLFPGRCERFFTYSASEHNTQGPSSFSTRTARGEVRLPRVHGVRPVIFEQVEMHEHIPFANLPMRQDVLATTFGPNNPLVYLEGVQIRRIDSISTSQESEFPTYMDVEHMSANQRMIMLHNRSVPRVDYTNYSGSSVAGFHYYHRNLRNTFMEHDNGTFATNGPREELDEEHDYTVNTTPEVRHVQGVQINDSHENETNETERKTIHQAETNHKSEFVINGSKENISPKIIPAQYLTKLANDTSRLQVNISSSCMHPSNISELEENVDVEDVLSEATTNDLDNENNIRDQSIEQIAPVIDEIDISVSACKEERASSDLSTSTISRRRELENVHRVYQHSRNSTNMDLASDDQLCEQAGCHTLQDESEQKSHVHPSAEQEKHKKDVRGRTATVVSLENKSNEKNQHRLPWMTNDAKQTDPNKKDAVKEQAGEDVPAGKDNVFKNCHWLTPNQSVDEGEKKNNVKLDSGPLAHSKISEKEESVKPVITERAQAGHTVTTSKTYLSSSTTSKLEQEISNKMDNVEGKLKTAVEQDHNNRLHCSDTRSQNGESNSKVQVEGCTCSDTYQTDRRLSGENKAADVDSFISVTRTDKEQAGSQTVQDKSDQESHAQPPAELEKCETNDHRRTGIESSLESNTTVKIQHPATCTANDSYHTYQNKEAFTGMNVVSQRSQSGVISQTDRPVNSADHYNTDQTSDDNPSRAAKHIVQKEEGISAAKSREMTVNQSAEINMMPMLTNVICNERERNIELFPSSEECAASTSEHSGSQTVQDKSDQESHVQPPAELVNYETNGHEQTGTESSLESNTIVKIQHPASCTANDSYHMNQNKEEHSGSQTVQNKSDQESHAQPPAELEKYETNDRGRTGTESSLEDNTIVRIQHPATCTANDSYHANQNKKGINVVSQRSKSGVISQAGGPIKPADHYNTDQTSDDDTNHGKSQIVNHTNTANPSQAAKHIVKKEEGISVAKSREMTVNQMTKICVMPMPTNGIGNERERNIELFPSSEVCAVNTSERRTGTETRHWDIIDLGAVTSEKDHRRCPADQQSQKSKQQSQSILPKTDVSCGKTSCQDIQDKKKTSLPTKLVKEKQSQRHVRRGRSCSESDKQTKKVSDSASESVSQDNATKIGKKRHVNKDILVSEGQKLLLNETHINGTGNNKSHNQDTTSEFNVDMRSHNETPVHNETDQAAEPKSDEHVAHTTVRLPNDRIHDRVVPLSSHKERNSPTGITVGETQKTKGKPKAFSPTDDSCIINKENVDGLKHELPDNDELLFATNIANEITKIKDPKRRNDVMMQCIHMIHEAQTQERSIEKKQNEVRPSPSRTLSNECFATEEE
ncbi:uncharacterized protein LOC128551988 isoform X2 [Mercenaria mercenaria]|uniref:uncharacterized protein LOC128551988 isoform X2 n=1 Tax=Mercenaria mercenaria TaxID=6596 RepID=UPI00234EABCB|nr:uncharacterized protein LOC128551988 isoform X2 [Mercenaria mercenaria]